MAADNMKCCTKCYELFDNYMFSKHTRTKDGLAYWCKNCTAKYNKTRAGELRPRLLKCLATSKESAIKRNLCWDLDYEALQAIYISQDGKCAISGERLSFDRVPRKSSDSRALMTIDRIDNSIGYLKDNIQFVTLQVNQAKSSYDIEDLFIMCENILTFNGRK